MRNLARVAFSIVTLWTLLGSTPVEGVAQAPSSDTVREWLLNACGVGEGQVTTDQLRALGAIAVSELVGAFEDGPASADMVDVQRSARLQFARIRALIARGSSIGLAGADLAAVQALTEAEYVARAESDFDFLYRSESLRGLAAMGGPEAVELLDRVATDADSPFADSANRLLGRR